MAEATNSKNTIRLGNAVATTARPPAALLNGASRAGDSLAPDPLLRCVEAVARYELGGTGRAAGEGRIETIEAEAGDVIALELDGFTLFTTADHLDRALDRAAPSIARDADATLESRLRAISTSRSVASAAAQALSVLRLGPDDIIEQARKKALELAGEWFKGKAKDFIAKRAELGATWLGTKALMWAVENQIGGDTRLCNWSEAAAATPRTATPQEIATAAAAGPLLVFIHGTASSTLGSFGELRTPAAAGEWARIRAQYADRIFALEHRTFSESPVENALVLAAALPAKARIHLVTHSRGGIVGDMMCLAAAEDAHIETFERRHEVDVPDAEGIAEADARDQAALRKLRAALQDKEIKVERYLRAACPARGTLLASENTDLFLSVLLNLVGLVVPLAGKPIYGALKRITLEIARNRTDPGLVPGLEAMLPNSPYARLTAAINLPPELRVAVMAGDIEGSGLFKRIAVFLTDRFIFERGDHDLVVDTDSMFGGVARKRRRDGDYESGTVDDCALYRFEQGPDVSHFRYFANRSSRRAIAEWLTNKGEPLTGFTAYADELRVASATERAVRRARAARAPGARPIVLLLPGIMGSHLAVRDERIWLHFGKIAFGGLAQIRAKQGGVKPQELFRKFYGDLVAHLGESNVVRPVPYDWRLSVLDAGSRLARQVAQALDDAEGTSAPVRIVAHSMGGLVVRAMVARHPEVWTRMIRHPGARVVMLGTPNRGSHLMVEMLLGIGGTIRKLAMLDTSHDLQELLDIVAEYPGALELLPNDRLPDDSEQPRNYLDAEKWRDWSRGNDDRWFGQDLGGLPAKAALAAVRETWKALDENAVDRNRILYVAGQAPLTPSGMAMTDSGIRMLATPHGDGSVAWRSGILDGMSAWYMAGVEHSDLARTERHFAAIEELLETGTTTLLPTTAPVRREARSAIPYDPVPVLLPTQEELEESIMGAKRPRPQRAAEPPLTVACLAGDLLHVLDPIIVGHYQKDPISGPEALIDRKFTGGALSLRRHLGLYPGAVGTAEAVFAPTEAARERAAIVVGLGEYGELTSARITQAVKAGVSEYLMQLSDRRIDGRGAEPDAEVRIASLLIGFNSTTSITIEDSVHAVIRGVLDANREVADFSGKPLRVARLDFVELYLDNAIAAAHALRRMPTRLQEESGKTVAPIAIERTLRRGTGALERLNVAEGQRYWPRLIVTDPDANDPAKARNRLEFLYLGQRAKANRTVDATQAEVVAAMVEPIITQPQYQPELSNALFQILLPNEFKDAARQAERLVMVVDTFSANLPWEMMAVDGRPLAERMAMVRQLSTLTPTGQRREAQRESALVVGDPSTAGFARKFGGKGDLARLPGAALEAKTVAALMQRNGIDTGEVLVGAKSLQIITALLNRSCRFVHIAAHGVHEQVDKEGKKKYSGVVLSDGTILTAALVTKMEVPELVFLNCCHLGVVTPEADTPLRDVPYQKLAASLARKFIEMGVRTVIVSGWAVDDDAALTFARVFYQCLLADRRSFGDAVAEARRATWLSHGHTNTWGAYQAYGDPDYVVDAAHRQRDIAATTTMKSAASESDVDVAVEEMVLRLQGLITQARDATAREALAVTARRLLREAPESWQGRGDILALMGELFGDLGSAYFAEARTYFADALGAEGDYDKVPIKVIEQLANLEARDGAARNDPDLIASAIRRLGGLIRLAAKLPPGEGAPDASIEASSERRSVMASAYKRLAILQARSGKADIASLRRDIDLSLRWYLPPGGELNALAEKPYRLLNCLQLIGVEKPDAKHAAMASAARGKLEQLLAEKPEYWTAIGIADATLTERLHDGSLAGQGPEGDKVATDLVRLYQRQRSLLPETAKSFDSVVDQIAALADLNAALRGPPLLTNRLRQIADSMQDSTATATASPTAAPSKAVGKSSTMKKSRKDKKPKSKRKTKKRKTPRP